MKYHKIGTWEYTDKMDCLLLFASLVDEMTFSYTVDSYKAPAMNIISLLEELYYTIDDVEEGVISDGAIQSIIEEVKESIEKDEIFMELLKDRHLSYVVELFRSGTKRDIKIAIELLSSIENLNMDYVIVIRHKLAELIKENKEKKLIERLTRLFITQLRYLGYSNEFLYYYNLRYFFSRESNIKSVNDIDDYLLRFDLTLHSYKVIFIGDSHFRMMKSHMKKLGDNISDDYIFESSHGRKYDFYTKRAKEGNGCFIEVNVDSFDSFQARNDAFERVEKFCVLFSFYHHKSTLKVSDDCVTIDMKTNEHCYLKSPVRSITKCFDMRPREANKRFRLIADQLNIDNESMSRLLKALWLHRQAVISKSEENQFVNLFTALEVLMPKEIGTNKDRIRQISDIIIPILCLAYYRKLVTALCNSLINWNPEIIEIIAGKVSEGNDLVDKFGAMLSLSKYDDLRHQLYKKLTDTKFILARYRIYRLNEILKDPKSVICFMNRHEKRLKQHIDRLYRIRNLIVHSGEAVDNLGSLLENLHFYFDVIVNAIFEDNINKGFLKLEFTFTSAVVRFKQYKHLLERADTFDENNYLELIFAR